MKIEHIGYNVPDPAAMARWYVENLGMRIAKVGQTNQAHFLADSAGTMMIEIYHNPDAEMLDYPAIKAPTLHLAFEADDVGTVRDRLLTAGAAAESEVVTDPNGDQMAWMRDPWGCCIQIVRRAERIL